jgi:cyclopropane fatty-acyl-phospholipid synthase-like methyltransferase
MKKLTEEEFLKAELNMGIGFHNRSFVDLANSTASQLHWLKYDSVLDYGCGTGVYADAFMKHGKNVAAYDISTAHTEYIKQNAPHIKLCKRPFTTDLLVWIEVAEHMTDKEIDELMTTIRPKYILFSSTSQKTSRDEEWGHINVKEQSEWVKMFDGYGYSLMKEVASPTLWSKVFELKQEAPIVKETKKKKDGNTEQVVSE